MARGTVVLCRAVAPRVHQCALHLPRPGRAPGRTRHHRHPLRLRRHRRLGRVHAPTPGAWRPTRHRSTTPSSLADDLGTSDVVLVGMRMGGLLAARAAARSNRPVSVVLWDPCGSGREFLREQSALFRLTYGKAKTPDGGSEVAGFVLSAETVEQLGALSAPGDQPDHRASAPVHPARPLPHRLVRDRREPAGAGGAAEGQAELMDTEPFFSIIPASTATIADWVDGALPAQGAPRRRLERRDEMIAARHGGRPARHRTSAHLGPDRLFGITTIGETATGPVDPPADQRERIARRPQPHVGGAGAPLGRASACAASAST